LFDETYVNALEKLLADLEIPDLRSRDKGQLVYIPEEGTNGHVYINTRAFTLNDGGRKECYRCVSCNKEQAFVCLTCKFQKDPLKKHPCHPPGIGDCSKKHENNES
jgi:hypothetical protein